MLNYFELFRLPTTFSLDSDQLQHNYRQLQSQYHPDNIKQFDDAKTLSQLKPDQLSAVINEAYQTLASTDSRAKHLLALQGITISSTDSIRDLDFLNEAMQLRIALDEADSGDIVQLQSQLSHWIDDCSQNFERDYRQLVTSDIDPTIQQSAIEHTQKLQFLVKLERDVFKKRDELAQISTDDDDLYV